MGEYFLNNFELASNRLRRCPQSSDNPFKLSVIFFGSSGYKPQEIYNRASSTSILICTHKHRHTLRILETLWLRKGGMLFIRALWFANIQLHVLALAIVRVGGIVVRRRV